MNKQCIKCGKEIHPLRLKALPNTKVCVECSTTGTYRGITTVNGTGEDTWNDLQLLTQDQYEAYEKAEKAALNMNRSPKSVDLEEEENA